MRLQDPDPESCLDDLVSEAVQVGCDLHDRRVGIGEMVEGESRVLVEHVDESDARPALKGLLEALR